MSLGGGGGLNSEINVTPLVDVMLVLLIVFMVTAPILNQNEGVELDLPETKAKDIEDPDGPVVLSIARNGTLVFNNEPVTWADLRGTLADAEKVQEKKELYIEADKTLPYAVVVTAMAVAQEAGVTKLQMMTDATAQLPIEKLDEGLDAVLGAKPAAADGATP